LGHGEGRTPEASTIVAGLAVSEQQTLADGPTIDLGTGVIDALIDRSSDIQIALSPSELSDRGLLDLVYARVPAKYQERVTRIRESIGGDILPRINEVSIWGTGIDAGDGFIGMAASSSTLSIVQLYDALLAISTYNTDESPDSDVSSNRMDLELTLFGAFPEQDIEAIYIRLRRDGELVKRIDFDSRNQLALFRDPLQRYYYAHLWPNGLRLEMLTNTPAKPLEAAARRAHDFVVQLNDRSSSSNVLPTVQVRFESGDGVVYLEARVDSSAELILELPMSILGSNEELAQVLENWDRMRAVVLRLVSMSPKLQQTPRLRDLIVAALQVGRITESLGGLRIETKVDTDLLVDGLSELSAD
jgi:hypothetical protein